MILSYIYNILKFKKWELLCLGIILIALRWSTIITLRANLSYLTELHKCPACYGVSACNYIHEVDITLHDFYSIFSYFFGVKNVFFGSFDKSKVVLKNLGQSSELNEFDRVLCENLNFSRICFYNTKKVDNNVDISFQELIKNEISVDFSQDNFNRLRLCPTTQHLNNLLQHVYENNKNIEPKILDINIWTLIVINPEPLVLQILSADKGWPVPKYFGACGRIVIEEYVGLPLKAYYNEPWLSRAKIASSLLDAAYLFTYGNENFSFYFTDISADNIAVDTNNNAKFIDLENVIIVDKNISPLGKEETAIWNEVQVNTENFSCPECLAFSSAEICSHKISDHNYYAICKIVLATNINNSILPGGFLHNIPPSVLQNYPNIQDLIQECVAPQMQFNRINAGMQLKELLDTIVRKQT